MKPMMAPAKTLADYDRDVERAINAFWNAADANFGNMRHPNNMNRVLCRMGHLLAQYKSAVKIRDTYRAARGF